MGHSSAAPVVNAPPPPFLPPMLWPCWIVGSLGWTGSSCGEILKSGLLSHCPPSPPSVIQYYQDVKTPYSDMGALCIMGYGLLYFTRCRRLNKNPVQQFLCSQACTESVGTLKYMFYIFVTYGTLYLRIWCNLKLQLQNLNRVPSPPCLFPVFLSGNFPRTGMGAATTLHVRTI